MYDIIEKLKWSLLPPLPGQQADRPGLAVLRHGGADRVRVQRRRGARPGQDQGRRRHGGVPICQRRQARQGHLLLEGGTQGGVPLREGDAIITRLDIISSPIVKL